MPEEPLTKNLQKLDRILQALDAPSLTRQEFEAAFQQVVDLIAEVQNQQAAAIAELESTYSILLDKVKSDHNENYSSLKGQVDGLFVGDKMEAMRKEHAEMQKMCQEMMDRADMKMKSLKDGKPGPKGEKGEHGSPDRPDELRDKLETLKGDDRLDKSAIRGLDELEKKITSAAGRGRIIGGGPNANAVQSVDLTSQADGSNKTFSVPGFRVALMLVSQQAPFILRPTTDFTIGNKQIILTANVDAPAANQALILLYVK